LRYETTNLSGDGCTLISSKRCRLVDELEGGRPARLQLTSRRTP
jgi:hypothetical protein